MRMLKTLTRSHGPTARARAKWRPNLEALEDRCLPSVTITEFPIPTPNSQPLGITSGPDGNLWFTEYASRKIGRMTTAGVVTAEFAIPTPNTGINGITAGPDGNLWFTEGAAHKIGYLTVSGTVTEFLLPSTAAPQHITTGPDGNVWFSALGSYNKIGSITLSGDITDFPIPTPEGQSHGITAGPDGNIWFTELAGNKIGRITPEGVITEFPIPSAQNSYAIDITAGPDGNLWFTEGIGNKIGRITPSGTMTEFGLPAGASPYGITAAPDGNLWFTEYQGNKIGRITPDGVITEFPIPTPSSQPAIITVGSDGNLWFTEYAANKIGRVSFDEPDPGPIYVYDPGLGTLPDAQGFSREENFQPAPPIVSGGLLHQFPSHPIHGVQHWFGNSVPLNFATGSYVLEADLRVISSNYIPNIGTGQRSGYYLWAVDSLGHNFAVGIASSGITINTDAEFSPNNGVPFTAFNTEGTFHTYRLVIDAGVGTLFIDGNLFASTPLGGAVRADVPNRVIFGDASGQGVSETDLRYFSFDDVDGDEELTVLTNADSGPGSLRQAILNANARPGLDTIAFFAGSGPRTINLASPLPTITDAVIIDGTTQPGYAGTPLIELNGAGAGPTADGLRITAGNSMVRGLAINRFSGDGIELSSGGNAIQGNFIGLDLSGTIARGNKREGVHVVGTDNLIGGFSPGEGNVVSGNEGVGVFIKDYGRNLVVGNFIGTDVTGTLARGNLDKGVMVFRADNNTIGGAADGAGNLISGNAATGVLFDGGSGNVVQGNKIGTKIDGFSPLGNSHGVGFRGSSAPENNLVVGTVAGQGNIIAGNRESGISALSGTRNAFLGNAIFNNGRLGIDLNLDGVTPNDPGDADTGPNQLQNYPVLTTAFNGEQGAVIQGTLHSKANTMFRLEFFANSERDPTGHGEGEMYLGFVTVTTNASGNVSFTANLAAWLPDGSYVTATATDPGNSTSEFSQAIGMTWMSPGPVDPIDAILSEWMRPDQTFALRIDHPTNGGEFNGTVVLNAATVHDDSGGDLSSAGADRDWFFGKHSDPDGDMLFDQALDEVLVDLT